MFGNGDDELWALAVWIWHLPQEKTYNFHLLTRKVFSLDAEITQATCMISTNSTYELQSAPRNSRDHPFETEFPLPRRNLIIGTEYIIITSAYGNVQSMRINVSSSTHHSLTLSDEVTPNAAG